MIWDIDPVLLKLGPIEIRYYGLFFALGFLVAFTYTKKIFLAHGFKAKEVDSILNYMIAGTVIGARLGHCLFYQPDYYLANPLAILKVWEGGLASHGGFAGVLIATFLYLKKWKRMSFFWLIEVMMAPIMFVAGMIRLGNLMNSEILGRITDIPWAFKFVRYDSFYRHPTPIYESLGYFSISLIMFILYKKYIEQGKWPSGRGLGVVFVLSFSFRFFIEFFKIEQVAFERGMSINMGQYLSIPFIILGLYFISGHQNKVRFFNFLTKPLK
ncbi:MAG: prolipoprotein diacylglyceryl transferase [Bacteriovoracaceae bacterium]|jgi:prolipoprotein diacylglyceryl transferase|nr:prolipoprotein diacylglyceryl transferase [Bacteriovoracaceae bacterium]